MKTKTYLGLSVAAVLTILASCNSQSTKTETETPVESTQTNGLLTPPQPKKHTIPVADIKAMIGKYRNERQEMINKNSDLKRSYGDSFLDTRCAWFSIDDLKSFIAEMEKDPKKLSGIRMYYTVYPEKKEGESEYMNSIPDKDRNHVSLLLIPTFFDDKSKSHVDFGPDNETQGQNHDLEEKGARSAAAAPSQQSGPALNHASLCPPNCPTAVPSGYLND